jgi:hypothetical protein
MAAQLATSQEGFGFMELVSYSVHNSSICLLAQFTYLTMLYY